MNETNFDNEALVHYDYFLNIARKMTGNIFDAEDLVQETYIRAYRFFHTFESGSNSKAWIYRIMKNLFINFSRKKTNHVFISLDDTIIEPVAKSDDSSVLQYDINRIMSNFKDEHRLVILLYLQEFTMIEISKSLNWPIGTVKSRLHRARKEFRKAFKDSIRPVTA